MTKKENSKKKATLTVSVDQQLYDALHEARWEQKTNLSNLVEAMIIDSGTRLDPPIPYCVEKYNKARKAGK